MPADTISKFRDEFVAGFAPQFDSASQNVADGFLKQCYCYNVDRPFDANSNSTSIHTLDASTNGVMTITSFKVCLRTTLTSANTNVATFALVYNDGAAGADTTIASLNTATTAGGGTGDITAEIPMAITLNTSNIQVPAGKQLQIKVTKSGAGGCSLSAASFICQARPA